MLFSMKSSSCVHMHAHRNTQRHSVFVSVHPEPVKENMFSLVFKIMLDKMFSVLSFVLIYSIEILASDSWQ